MRTHSRPSIMTASIWAAGAALWLGMLAAALGAPSVVRADGGAPVVAYVVGGGQDGAEHLDQDPAGADAPGQEPAEVEQLL